MVEARARSRDLESRWRRLVIAIGSNGGNMERPEEFNAHVRRFCLANLSA
jgi:hypothetical protein